MMARRKAVGRGACLLLLLSLSASQPAQSADARRDCTTDALVKDLLPYTDDMGNRQVCTILVRLQQCLMSEYTHPISADGLDYLEASFHTHLANDEFYQGIKCQFIFRVIAGLEEGEPFTVPGEASYHEALPTSTPGPQRTVPPKTAKQCRREMMDSLAVVHRHQKDWSDLSWACPYLKSYLRCLEEVSGRRMDEGEIDRAIEKIMMGTKFSCGWINPTVRRNTGPTVRSNTGPTVRSGERKPNVLPAITSSQPPPSSNTELHESGSGDEESEISAEILDGRSQSIVEELGLERNPVYQQCRLKAIEHTQWFRDQGEMASGRVCPIVVTFIKCLVGASGITPSQQRLPLIERMVREVIGSAKWLRGLTCRFEFQFIPGFSQGRKYHVLTPEQVEWNLQHSTQAPPSEGDQKTLKHSTQAPPSEGDPCIRQWEAGVRALPAGGDMCPLVTSFLRCRQTSPPAPTAETSPGDQDNIEQQVARIAPSCQNIKGEANPQASKDSNSGPSCFGSGWPTQGILAAVGAILVWKLLG